MMSSPNTHCPLEPPPTSRRHFLKVLMGFLALLWAGMATLPIFRFLGSKGPQEDTSAVSTVSLGDEKVFPKGSSKNFQFGSQPGLIIRQDDGQFVAFNAVCTHLGCTVQYESAGKQIVCACHGGQYNAQTGDNIAGPPPKPLQKLLVKVSDTHEIIVSKG